MCSGYEEEAFVYLRILAEAKGRAMQVVQDDSGEYARQWLGGKGGKPAKANPELPQEIWTGLSASAHVDVASILRSGLENGRDVPLLRNGPHRFVPRANATLALGGSQAADVMFSLAYLRGIVLPDEEEFIQLVKATLETYAPGEDAEAWTSGQGNVETLRVDRRGR